MKPVWIIDDDRSIRWVLEKSLARADIEFKSFATADDALRALSLDLPQVMLMQRLQKIQPRTSRHADIAEHHLR